MKEKSFTSVFQKLTTVLTLIVEDIYHVLSSLPNFRV